MSALVLGIAVMTGSAFGVGYALRGVFDDWRQGLPELGQIE